MSTQPDSKQTVDLDLPGFDGPSYRFEGGDVPGAFVNIMNAAMDGTVWVPIETMRTVFPQVLSRFGELPLWALQNQRRDVLEFCSFLHENELVSAMEALLQAVCDALPGWEEASLSIVLLSRRKAEGRDDAAQSDVLTAEGERVSEQEADESIQIIALHESDFESIEQAHGFEAGTLRKWREKYEEVNEGEKQRRRLQQARVGDGCQAGRRA